MKQSFFRKTISLIITVMMLLSVVEIPTVHAEQITVNAVYNAEDYSLNVTGSSGNSNESFTIIIVPNSIDAEDLSDSNLPSDMRISMTDGNGNFAENIALPENLEGGAYKVYVFTNGSVSSPQKFIHINKEEAIGIIHQIDNCRNGREIENVINANAVKLGIDPDNAEKYGEFICSMIYAHKPQNGYSSSDDPASKLLGIYNISLVCIDIASGENIEKLLSDNEELLGISYGEYSLLSQQEKEKLNQSLKGIDYTKGEFNKLFSEQLFLARLTCSDRWSKLKEAVMLYGEAYGMKTSSSSTYSTLSNKDNVFKTMLSDSIQKVETVDAAVKIFNSAVDKQHEKEKSGDKSDLPEPEGGMIVVRPYPDNMDEGIDFSDIDSCWAKDIILNLAGNGIISGFDDKSFKPDYDVTRAEFIKMITTVMKYQTVKKDIFEDVTSDDWFYEYIGGAYENGIITGDGNTFLPNESITRQEASVIVYRCIADKLNEGEAEFIDKDEISEYALAAVNALASSGIIQGADNMFRPNDKITRAESSALLNNILNLTEQSEIKEYLLNSSASSNREKSYASMISIMTSLGMQEGDKNLDEELTTGEFINLLVTLINSDRKENADDIKTPYENIPLGHPYAASINTALEIGFISADDVLNIDEPIKPSLAIKMLISTLGYSDYVKITQSNYLHAAYELGIFTGTEKIHIDDSLTYYNAVVMLNNMLQSNPFKSYSGSGGRYDFAKSSETYLEAHYDINSAVGIVEANEFTSLTDIDGHTGKGQIKIGTDTFDFAGIDTMLGHRVKYYYKEKNDSNPPSVIYMEDKSTVITQEPMDMTYDDFEYQYGEKGNKKAKVDKGFSFTFNGKAYNGYTTDDMVCDSGFVTLIDNDNDGVYEVVSIESFDYIYVQQVNPTYDNIHDRNGAETLDLSSDYATNTIYDDVTGSEIDISEIESDDVIGYASSKDGEYNVLHKLKFFKGVFKASSDDTITVDDTVYKTNAYFNKYYKSALIIGTEAEFALDVNGRIAAMRNIDNDKYRYAWLVNVYNDESGDNTYAKLFDQSGAMRVLKLSDSVSMNGNAYKHPTDNESFWEIVRKDGKTVRQLVRYRVSGDNCLKVINLSVDVGSSEYNSSLFKTDLPQNGNLIRYYDATTGNKLKFIYRPKSFGNLFNISSTKFLFVVPETEKYVNDDSYYAIGYNSFNTGALYKVSAYNLDMGGCAEAAVYHVNLNEEAVRQSQSGIVDSIKTAVDDDGEICKLITVYNGEYTDLYVPMDIPTDDSDVGDYIRYNIHTNGKVTKITKDFDYSDWEVIYGSTADMFDCTAGQIYSFQSNYIMLSENKKADGTFDMGIGSLKNYKLDSYAVFDTKSKKVLTANTEDIKVYINDQKDASKVFIRFDNSMSTGYAVIYI